MVIHELTPDECRQLLADNTLGRLACARSDQPYITPLFYYFDATDDCLYAFATVGQKIEWMRDNPKVCIEVDQITDQFQWTTVVAFGRYEELSEAAGAGPVLERARALFERNPNWWLPGTGRLVSEGERETPVVYRIRIDRATGRRASRPTP
jgi:nitroimidazol reductase NimA-like FMN-containing flavoprotein (pyridoxamine 5'-phosphate oxidase superfamily)